MDQVDFTEFEANLEAIFTDADSLDLHLIKKRIVKEIEQLESNPDISEQFKKVRIRIREIENKALKKLGKKANIPENRNGAQCSFCSSCESDVEIMVRLNQGYNICKECALLFRQVVENRND